MKLAALSPQTALKSALRPGCMAAPPCSILDEACRQVRVSNQHSVLITPASASILGMLLKDFQPCREL